MLLDLYPQIWTGDGAAAPSVIVTVTIPLECSIGSVFLFSRDVADTTQTFSLGSSDQTQTFSLDTLAEG